ncbi:MAG: hypothetical protein H6727_12360 [Myxococcales bacterium]|nr:hypothetical protein [Myxococcales bacterium]
MITHLSQHENAINAVSSPSKQRGKTTMGQHFDIATTELQIDPPSAWRDRYSEVYTSGTQRPHLGTEIWWAEDHEGQARCLKEFMAADLEEFGRKIPDPSWGLGGKPRGAQRGLASRRAAIFDQLHHGSLKQELARFGPGAHPDFRSLFCISAFELESLITQFARYYGYNQIVQANYWGAVRLDSRKKAHPIIEMERLSPLTLPAPHDALSILDRLLAMMSAVTQLHGMQIPLRCYPPELVPDLESSDAWSFARPFHYDLSPDQFLLRQGNARIPDQVVLIDFNAARIDQTDFSEFAWRSIPGKDYYQPPERRAHQIEQSLALSYRSHPSYDLYALLVIALFLFARTDGRQQKIQQIDEWSDIKGFYGFLFQEDLRSALQKLLPPRKYIDPSPLIDLMYALFQKRPEQRTQALLGLDRLGWRRESDWTLLARSMNLLATEAMGRSFRATWKTSHLQVPQESAPLALTHLLEPRQTTWSPGKWENGRINHPLYSQDQIFFLQESGPPALYEGSFLPHTPGRYSFVACFGGCVDFQHPLQIDVIAQPQIAAPSQSQAKSSSSYHAHSPSSSSMTADFGPSPESTADFGSSAKIAPQWSDSAVGYASPSPDDPSDFAFQASMPAIHDPEINQPQDPRVNGKTEETHPSATTDLHDTLMDDPALLQGFWEEVHASRPRADSVLLDPTHTSELTDSSILDAVSLEREDNPAGTHFFRRDPMDAVWSPPSHQPLPSPVPASSPSHGTGRYDREAAIASSRPSSQPMASLSPSQAQRRWEPPPGIDEAILSDPPWVEDLKPPPSSHAQRSSQHASSLYPEATHHDVLAARSQRAENALDQLVEQVASKQQMDHPIGRWLEEIQQCNDLEKLKRDEENARQMAQEDITTLLLINILSRQCFLLCEKQQLRARSQELHHLAMLRDNKMPAVHIEGLWLNNLAMVCCRVALQEQRWPSWEGLIGFSPIKALAAWLKQHQSTHPTDASPRFWEIRDCVRDTLDVGLRIRTKMREKNKR